MISIAQASGIDGIQVFGTATAAEPAPPALGTSGGGWQWLASAVEMAAMASGNWPITLNPSADSWTRQPRIATRTPGSGPGSVRAAREFTMATLRRWGATAQCDEIVVVVSELVTNAMRHAAPGPDRPLARGAVRLGLLLQPGPCVLCAVSDPSDATPVVREPSWFEETGRGLHVVASLSDQWGWTLPGPAGKVVWAMFNPTGPAGCARG